jgi:hypothetical protein
MICKSMFKSSYNFRSAPGTIAIGIAARTQSGAAEVVCIGSGAASMAHLRGRVCGSSGFREAWCLPFSSGSAFSSPRLPNHVHMATAINQEIGVSSYWAVG